MSNVGIILSGGRGKRFAAKFPKQYMSLNGKLVIQYVIDEFQKSNLFDKIIVVIEKKYISLLKNVDDVIFAEAGENRTISAYNGLQMCPQDTKYILFHDAARPFISQQDLKIYLDALKKNKAAITSAKITDALFHAPRDNFKLIQTPEAFQYKHFKQHFDFKNNYVALYEHVFPCTLKFIELSHTNFKITSPEDIYIAEQLMKYQSVIKRTPNISNKRILLFGATGGIGKEIQKQLQQAKAVVIAPTRQQVNLSTLSIHSKIFKQKYDCIINCAACYYKDSDIKTDAQFNEMINTNIYANYVLLKVSSQCTKNLILIGSTAASYGRENIGIYSATKSALNTLVEAYHKSLAQHNVNVNVICPAKVYTKLQKYFNPTAKKDTMMKPKDIAKIIIGYIDINTTGNIVYVRVGQE
jgi:2-C-methyl-D-erythritol 4-phosphate cytidylyltransferase